MKKLLLILLLPLLLWGCGSETSVITKDGDDVKVSQKLLERIKNYKPDETVYIAPSADWQKTNKLAETEGLDELDTYSDEEQAIALGQAEQPFQLFQVEEDQNGQYTQINWIMQISDEPSIEFLQDQPTAYQGDTVTVSEEGVAGLPTGLMNYNPVKYEIWLEPIVNSLNVNTQYEGDHVLSFRIDKRDRVIEVWQWPKKKWQRDDFVIYKNEVNPGATEVLIDTSRGDRFTLYIKTANGEMTFLNLDKNKEISLRNLEIIEIADRRTGEPPLALQANYVEPTKPVAETTETTEIDTEDLGFQTDFNKSLEDQLADYAEYEKMNKMRLAKRRNYGNGYIRFNCTDLACQDPGLFNTLVKWGAIGVNPKTGNVQDDVIIAPAVLKEQSPDLYQKNKKRIKYFKK